MLVESVVSCRNGPALDGRGNYIQTSGPVRRFNDQLVRWAKGELKQGEHYHDFPDIAVPYVKDIANALIVFTLAENEALVLIPDQIKRTENIGAKLAWRWVLDYLIDCLD